MNVNCWLCCSDHYHSWQGHHENKVLVLVLSVVCGGSSLPAGHISLVETDLVTGDWLTAGIISSYIADRRQGGNDKPLIKTIIIHNKLFIKQHLDMLITQSPTFSVCQTKHLPLKRSDHWVSVIRDIFFRQGPALRKGRSCLFYIQSCDLLDD